jgi:hypothetical protein
MRPLSVVALALLLPVSSFVKAQTAASSQTSPPQTARQALIEMFFGTAANHLEKHLPEVTRKTFKRMDSGNGRSFLSEFSMLATQAKSSGAAFQTFDTGPTLLSAEEQRDTSGEKVEITVERDDLVGDEDQIELALHMTRGGKEDRPLPFIPRFTFSMKMESEVWRLNEISVTVRLPLADQDFLKNIEDRQRTQNEQMTIWSLRTVVAAEKSYQSAQGGFACALSKLGNTSKPGINAGYFDPELAAGKKNGYIYAISGCDSSHYKIVAEPAVPDSGQRAFCSDESGAVRASADGKATTCLSRGEAVTDDKGVGATGAVGVMLPRD